MREAFQYYINFYEGDSNTEKYLTFICETEDPTQALLQIMEYFRENFGKVRYKNFSGPNGKVFVFLT